MADKDTDLTPEDAQRAIAKAAEKRPQVAVMRERLQKLAGDEERGLQLLAAAIKRMLREG